jgi:hypothetical protein
MSPKCLNASVFGNAFVGRENRERLRVSECNKNAIKWISVDHGQGGGSANQVPIKRDLFELVSIH